MDIFSVLGVGHGNIFVAHQLSIQRTSQHCLLQVAKADAGYYLLEAPNTAGSTGKHIFGRRCLRGLDLMN